MGRAHSARDRRTRHTVPPRAFTMIEVAVSTVIVGLMIGTAMEMVGTARVGQMWNSDKLRALALAQAMMGEVVDSYYQDPAAAIVVFGPEAGESQAIRTTLNDVDDYNGISGAPTNRDGTAIPGLSNWRRTVAVAWVTLANPNQTSAAETGLKRITVDVYRGNARLAELVAYRASGVPR